VFAPKFKNTIPPRLVPGYSPKVSVHPAITHVASYREQIFLLPPLILTDHLSRFALEALLEHLLHHHSCWCCCFLYFA